MEEEYLELETINFAVESLYKSILKVMDLHYMYKDEPTDFATAEEAVTNIWALDVQAEVAPQEHL